MEAERWHTNEAICIFFPTVTLGVAGLTYFTKPAFRTLPCAFHHACFGLSGGKRVILVCVCGTEGNGQRVFFPQEWKVACPMGDCVDIITALKLCLRVRFDLDLDLNQSSRLFSSV